MIKKLGSLISNMKLKYKMFFVYGVVGVIPMILTIGSSVLLMTSILMDKEEKNIDIYLDKAAFGVDSELIAYNSLSDYIAFNDVIARVLVSDYTNRYDLYNQIVSVIKPQLETVTYFSDSAVQVSIYTDIDGNSYEDIILPLDNICNEYWYRAVCRDVARHWYVDSEKEIAFCVRRMAMMKNQGKLGVFYVSVDYNKLFEALTNDIGKNYGIFVTDKNDELIYSYAKFEDRYSDLKIEYDKFHEIKGSDDYKVIFEDLEQTSWRLWMYKPVETIKSDTEPIRNLVIIVAVVAIISMVIGVIAITRFVIKRISYLKDGMEKARENNFKLRLEAVETDEIGELIRGYNTLMEKIETLIKEVYESEIAQKKYEMKALQNQINPHFLYNSLSLINWKAIEKGNKDISDITLALSRFYRTSLNKGRNTLSIEDEISNVRSYIEIQLVMHDNEFDVEYDIDEEIYKYETLNLILQPIVENSIEHGIDVRKDEVRGCIKVKGWREDKDIYISVTDNGVGMDEEKAKNILTQNSKGYGIRNVNERIGLYYGEEYCLNVASVLKEGTCITVHIPAIEM